MQTKQQQANDFLTEYTRAIVKTLSDPMGRKKLIEDWTPKLAELIGAK